MPSATILSACSIGRKRTSGSRKAVDGIPPGKRGARAAGFDHSPWELLEHIRIAQEDILDFCVNRTYEHTMKWPDDYWPKDPAPPSEQAWTDSLAAYARSLDAMKRLAREADLTATVPTGKEQPNLSARHSARPPIMWRITWAKSSRSAVRWGSGHAADDALRSDAIVRHGGREIVPGV